MIYTINIFRFRIFYIYFMIRFNEYNLIKENFNQMKSLIQKNDSSVKLLLFGVENGISVDSDIYQLLRILIGPDINFKAVSHNVKFKDLYGNIEINEEKERIMRPYLGMFAKMLYEEKCDLDILSDISQYIIQNKATLNQLKVKNNHTGELTSLTNLLDIFKFRDSIHEHDKRPAYEILTDAIRDKDKSTSILKFINEMPSVLKQQFKDDESNEYQTLHDLVEMYDGLDNIKKENIYSTFFGNGTRKGKISKYHKSTDFLSDFETMVKNTDDFNTDIIKTRDKILNTRGAKLVLCDLEKNIIIADIWNHKASNILGVPSSWCISYPNTTNYWYNTYMSLEDKRKMYFIWNFNLPFNDKYSKIGANINNNGTYNLVCDKNDTALRKDVFDDYLVTYNINKNYLKPDISPEEKEFKERDNTLKDIISGKNIFASITDANYKTEIPKILQICKDEQVDLTPEILSSSLLRDVQKLDNNFEIYKFILDILGTEKYEKKLFTLLLNGMQEKYISYHDDLVDLYELLGSNIDLNLIDIQSIEINIHDIPSINNKIYEKFEDLYYDMNFESDDDVSKIIEFVTSRNIVYYIDDNFEKFFKRFEYFMGFVNTSVIEEFIEKIFIKLNDIETKNNFLVEINKLYTRNKFCDANILNATGKYNGFAITRLTYMFFKNIFDSFFRYNNIDTTSNASKERLVHFITLHDEYLQKYFKESKVHNSSFIDLFITLNLSVREYDMFSISIDYDRIKEIYHNRFSDILYLFDKKYLKIDTKKIDECIEDVFLNDLYLGENIGYINNLYDIFLENKRYVDMTNVTLTDNNINFLSYLFDNNKTTISMKLKCLKENVLMDKCMASIKKMDGDDLVQYIVGNNEIADKFIYEEADLTGVSIPGYYIEDWNPSMLKKLLLNKCVVNEDRFKSMLEKGFFKDENYNNESIDCINLIGLKLKYVNCDVFKNSLTVIKYLFDNQIIIDISKGYGSQSNLQDTIIATNDLEKIKYAENKIDIKYNPKEFRYSSYMLNTDVLEYFLNKDICNEQFMFYNVDSIETFEALYNKYWKDFSYNEINSILSKYLEFGGNTRFYADEKNKLTIPILNFLYDKEPGTLEEVVKDNYELNKRKKVYTDEVREWIKAKYFTKTKVKKIREMFEYVFKYI